MTCISKQNLSKPERRKVKVPLPECGLDAYVWLEELSAKWLIALWERATNTLEGLYEALAASLVDDEGNRIYESVEDFKAHNELSFDTLNRLGDELAKVSGFPSDKPKN